MRLNAPYAPETPDFVETPEGRKAVPERMTAAEFTTFGFDEKDKWELIGGCPVMSPAPTPPHQALVAQLIQLFGALCSERPELDVLSEVDILFTGDENVLRPDICIVRADDQDWDRGPLQLVPALVVEILSPSTSGRDHGIKREIYGRAGVPEYWIADPVDGSLTIHTNPQGGEYSQQPADEDGFKVSPFVGTGLRIQRLGRKYRILQR
jgi:Uma2 family endonuclease